MRPGPLAAALGLIPAAAVGAWWLAMERVGGAPAGVSVAALQTLWLCQMLVVVLFGPRLGATVGRRAATAALCASVAIAWPLAAALGSATFLGARSMLLPQAALMAAACGLPALGAAVAGKAHGSRGWGGAAPTALALASVLSAAILWSTREHWLAWLT